MISQVWNINIIGNTDPIQNFILLWKREIFANLFFFMLFLLSLSFQF